MVWSDLISGLHEREREPYNADLLCLFVYAFIVIPADIFEKFKRNKFGVCSAYSSILLTEKYYTVGFKIVFGESGIQRRFSDE